METVFRGGACEKCRLIAWDSLGFRRGFVGILVGFEIVLGFLLFEAPVSLKLAALYVGLKLAKCILSKI